MRHFNNRPMRNAFDLWIMRGESIPRIFCVLLSTQEKAMFGPPDNVPDTLSIRNRIGALKPLVSGWTKRGPRNKRYLDLQKLFPKQLVSVGGTTIRAGPPNGFGASETLPETLRLWERFLCPRNFLFLEQLQRYLFCS
jgi:hypothetical protein